MIRRKEFTEYQLAVNNAINELKLEIMALKHENALLKSATSSAMVTTVPTTDDEKISIQKEQEKRDRVLAEWSEDPETIANIYGV